MSEITSDDIERLAAWVRGFTTIETPRLTMRRLSAEDAEALHGAMRNERVNSWISGFAQPFDLSAMRRWLAPRLERMERGEGIYGAILHRESGVMLGFMHAVMEPELGGVELAAALQEVYWGKGFVEEGAFALINDLFDAGLSQLVATCALTNRSSIVALHALAFTQTATIDIVTPQGPRPSFLFMLTPEAWRSIRLMPFEESLCLQEIRARRKAIIAETYAVRERSLPGY